MVMLSALCIHLEPPGASLMLIRLLDDIHAQWSGLRSTAPCMLPSYPASSAHSTNSISRKGGELGPRSYKKVTLVGSDQLDLSRAYSSVGDQKSLPGTYGVGSRLRRRQYLDLSSLQRPPGGGVSAKDTVTPTPAEPFGYPYRSRLLPIHYMPFQHLSSQLFCSSSHGCPSLLLRAAYF